MRLRVPHIARWLAIAALAGVSWAPAMETIEFDGFVASFDPDQEFTVLEGDLDCTRFGGPAALRVTETAGRAGEADYLVYLPAEWNGDLVTFGHGLLAPMRPAGRFWFPLPLGFGPERAEMAFVVHRDIAVCQGFAWAASAMAGVGFTITEGIRDTHLLLAVSGRHLQAEPAATYVTGFDAPGGLVAVALAETYPHRYDGALAIYAPLAGLLPGIDQIFHIRVLFDALFPDLLEPFTPGERAMTPPEFMAFAGKLQARIESDPDALRRMGSVLMPGSAWLDPAGIGLPLLPENPLAPDRMAAFTSQAEALIGTMNMWLFLGELFQEQGGGNPHGNLNVTYTSPDMTADELADLNARVTRVEADPWAVRHWTFNYHPSGDLMIPLVSLRPAHDFFGSAFNVRAYAEAVARHGAEDLFSSYAPNSYVILTPAESATAFDGLVQWVRTGVRPTWPTTP